MDSENSRPSEMKELRFVKKWTLREIANKFGVSRERVRQIIGNTGNGVLSDRRSEQISMISHLSNNSIVSLTGISRGTIAKYRGNKRHAIDGGNFQVGTEMENFVSDVLDRKGIKNKLMPHHHPFDIMLENGLRIDVKSSNPYESLSVISPLYSFNTERKRRGFYTDFFVLVTADTREIFVVPIEETREGSPVRFCFPEPDYGRKSKWLKYHNRFDLLRKP